jgi:hypothetical protein
VPGVILDAFVDENDRPRYFVTKKALFFMRPDGNVRKRIARKSDPGHLEGPPMGFSDDGSWAWQAYVDEDHADAQHPYEWIKTDIYDPRGRLWWTIQGHLEHISPDGKRAAAMLPEGSGMVLYKKGDSRESTLEDGKRFIEPGTTMEYACPSNDGAIYISSMGGSEINLLDDNHENKRVIARIAAHCYLNACERTILKAESAAPLQTLSAQSHNPFVAALDIYTSSLSCHGHGLFSSLGSKNKHTYPILSRKRIHLGNQSSAKLFLTRI